jgi:phosphate/sulfate permease
MAEILHTLSFGTLFFLMLALAIALAFEFVNGFHDTANAVATVIYTNSLKPKHAVVWSGICNFLGVYLGGIGVAFSIVYLLPVDLLIRINSGSGMAMVMALLLAAIIWNFGTWYMAIPASSSHTLIGAILGVGLASSIGSANGFGSGVNWTKAGQVGMSLLVSPILGFGFAAALLLISKRMLPQQKLHEPAPADRPPPAWVRAILIFTCTGVSLAHGSNDGQKGIGLIMLILIGILPAHYALNADYNKDQIQKTVEVASELEELLDTKPELAKAVDELHGIPAITAAPHRSPAGGRTDRFPGSSVDAGAVEKPNAETLREDLQLLQHELQGVDHMTVLSPDSRWGIRTRIMRLDYALAKLAGLPSGELPADELATLASARKTFRGMTDYSPMWVIVAVAFALGLGTMIGWERIVVTIGEKIGKTHMTYAQGASAELIATFAIGMADFLHLPVSTTHVLSSGIAGTMAANRSGIQASTIRSILMAWILTLPVTMALSAGLFLLFNLFV